MIDLPWHQQCYPGKKSSWSDARRSVQRWFYTDQYFCMVCEKPLPTGRHVRRNVPRCCSADCKYLKNKFREERLVQRRREQRAAHPPPPQQRRHSHCIICGEAIGDGVHYLSTTCGPKCWRINKNNRQWVNERKPARRAKRKATRTIWLENNKDRIRAAAREYKRLHPRKRKSRAKPPVLVNCAACGSEFLRRHHRQRFCSYWCSYQRHRKPLKELHCRDCGVRIGKWKELCDECRVLSEAKNKRVNATRNKQRRKAVLRAAFELGLISGYGKTYMRSPQGSADYSALVQLGLTKGVRL